MCIVYTVLANKILCVVCAQHKIVKNIHFLCAQFKVCIAKNLFLNSNFVFKCQSNHSVQYIVNNCVCVPAKDRNIAPFSNTISFWWQNCRMLARSIYSNIDSMMFDTCTVGI